MRCLLDTQIAVWAVGEPTRLSSTVAALLSDESNELIVSDVSLLEIAIKLKIGKLPEFIATLDDVVD